MQIVKLGLIVNSSMPKLQGLLSVNITISYLFDAYSNDIVKFDFIEPGCKITVGLRILNSEIENYFGAKLQPIGCNYSKSYSSYIKLLPLS